MLTFEVPQLPKFSIEHKNYASNFSFFLMLPYLVELIETCFSATYFLYESESVTLRATTRPHMCFTKVNIEGERRDYVEISAAHFICRKFSGDPGGDKINRPLHKLYPQRSVKWSSIEVKMEMIDQHLANEQLTKNHKKLPKTWQCRFLHWKINNFR